MAVIEQRKGGIGYQQLLTDDSVAKVSIVGVGIRSNPQLAATMFEALGLDPELEIRDKLNRPLPIARGKAIREVLE